MFKTIVLSKLELIKLLKNIDDNVDKSKIAIISIREPNDTYDLSDEIITLKCYFHDIEENIDRYQAINDSNANDIARFIKDNQNNISWLIVQCDAGISRSSACAAAIMKYFTGDDSLIFNDKRYLPNKLVYRKVLNALHD